MAARRNGSNTSTDPPPSTGRGRGRGNTGLAQGGGRPRGVKAPTGVNTDPMKQPDEKLRALNMQPTTPGPREAVFCTKVGTTHPDEMYIVSGHMDGHGWGEAANDDGSGTALVMELARVLSAPDVQTERTIRFALWNNEETGSQAARAYIAQRQALQGKEDPPGSRKYPEPKWLGMIQHDMMLFDHGMPRPDGTMSKEQRPEADVNVEFQVNSKMAAESQKLAWVLRGGEREIRDRLSGHGRQPHDQHRLRAVHRHHRRRSACAKTSVACTSATAGIRNGTSRPTCTPPTTTRIFCSVSTPRKRRWARSDSLLVHL